MPSAFTVVVIDRTPTRSSTHGPSTAAHARSVTPTPDVSRDDVGVNRIAIADIAASPGAMRNGVNMRDTIASNTALPSASKPSLPYVFILAPQIHSPRLTTTSASSASTYGEPLGAIQNSSGMNT